MGIFTLTCISAFLGSVLAIAGCCEGLPRMIVMGLFLMAPEMGNEAGFWTIPIRCTEVLVQGCIK